MKGVVLIKTGTGAAVNSEDKFARAGSVLGGVLGKADAHAVEAALRMREEGRVDAVTVVAVAPSSEILGGVRAALAMGADTALIVVDNAVECLDVLESGQAVAALCRASGGSIFFHAPWTGDIDGSLMWGIAASRRDMPLLSQSRKLTWADGIFVSERQIEAGDVTLVAEPPCFIEVTEALNLPRRPSVKAVQAARTKPVRYISLADIGYTPPARPATVSVAAGSITAKRETTMIVADDDTAEQILLFLEGRGLLE